MTESYANMGKIKHEYPSKYPPGVHWAIDAAWSILDSLKPGRLNGDERAFLAGQIAGALLSVRNKEEHRNVACKVTALRRGAF